MFIIFMNFAIALEHFTYVSMMILKQFLYLQSNNYALMYCKYAIALVHLLYYEILFKLNIPSTFLYIPVVFLVFANAYGSIA